MLDKARSDERGVTLIMVTASLLFMFGLAAIVVDGGMGWSERRQAQSGVDFGALAALNFAKSCHEVVDPCSIDVARNNGAEEAIEVVEGNLPGRDLDWENCEDPGPRPGFIPSGRTDCVSFTENNDRSRVVLPIDAVSTSFGRVLGFDQLLVRAVAEAGQGLNTSASIIPFAPKGGGPELCLFTNQTPQAIPPCDGPETGHFGYLDIALFGNDDLGTPSTCQQGNQNSKIAVNIALGSDHVLTTHEPPTVNDHDACPNRSEDVNEVVIEPGSPTNVPTTSGLYSGVNTVIVGNSVSAPARLRCTSDSVACENVRTVALDHSGLWNYLLDGKCDSAVDHTTMAECLDSWTPGTGIIFSSSISDNLRFTAVPGISPTANPLRWTIDEFIPVWIETFYMGCNTQRCATIHSPGEPSVGECPNPFEEGIWSCGWDSNALGSSIEQVTAFELDLEMLPQSIQEFFPGVGQTRSTALTR